MTLFQVETCSPNGPGIDLYLKELFVQDSQFPLAPDGEYVAVAVPHTAVVLLPASDAAEVDWPLTVARPPDFDAALTEVPY